MSTTEHTTFERTTKTKIGTTLYDLCNAGSVPAVLAHLSQKTSADPSFKPPLSKMMEIAAENNDVPLIEYCLRADGPVTGDLMQRIAHKRPYHVFKAILMNRANRPDQRFLHAGKLCTVATYAATADDIYFVKLCFAHGARTRYTEFENYSTALAAIAEKASIEMVALWLENGAVLKGSGAIVAAAGAGRTDMVKFLLEQGADINEVNTRHQRAMDGDMKVGGALHQAVRNGREDMLALLLERGGDVGLKDARGDTPISLAHKQQNLKMMEMLQKKKSQGSTK